MIRFASATTDLASFSQLTCSHSKAESDSSNDLTSRIDTINIEGILIVEFHLVSLQSLLKSGIKVLLSQTYRLLGSYHILKELCKVELSLSNEVI